MQNISFSLDVEGKKQQKEDMLNNEGSRLLFSVEHKKACRMIRMKIKSNEPKEILGIDIIKVFTSYNNPKGNANTERYFRTYKEEVAWVLDNPSYEELVERTKDFERFYNEEYPHSAISYKSPKEVFEESLGLHKIA